jgi:hypothetical protein
MTPGYRHERRCRWRSEQNPSKDNSQAQGLLERDERKIEALRISEISFHRGSRRCAVDDEKPHMAIRRVAEKVRLSHMQTQRCENERNRQVSDMSTVRSVLAILAKTSDQALRQR